MSNVRIAIVDYGVGNLRSVERALAHVGAEPVITADLDLLGEADGLVLPGVGAFGAAIARLSEHGLAEHVASLAKSGKPVLGVCLGYQLLFDESLEGGRHAGLGLLPGRVVPVRGTHHVPVIGWSRVRQTAAAPVWDGVEDGAYFYFVHSFAPESSEFAIGCSDHAPAAAASRGSVIGTQFHPEKSGQDGLRIYRTFARLCA